MLSRHSINTRSLSSSDFSNSYLNKFTIKQNIICRSTVVTKLINKPIILSRSVMITYRGKIVSKSISNISTIGITTNWDTVIFSLLKFTFPGLPKTSAIFCMRQSCSSLEISQHVSCCRCFVVFYLLVISNNLIFLFSFLKGGAF